MTFSHPDMPVPIGEVVDGKYRVERMIGAGGMGCVVEATHLQLLKPVALKFLLASEEGTDAATRLVREARAAVALQSDHVARVLDVGTLRSGMPYIVMEYLDGQTLAQVLHGGKRLAPEDARRIAIESCRALGEAHRRGIVHRDVKPGNIFLANLEDGSSRVKVLDFGIAKVTDPSMAVDPQLTGTEHALGTPKYMAPEQLSASRDVDARADVWAMGIVLYECLVGSNPFSRGGTAFEIGARILIENAPRVSESLQNVPRDLDDIVARCLDRDRLNRFMDANELLGALERRHESNPKTRAGIGPIHPSGQLPPVVPLPPTVPKALRAPVPTPAEAVAVLPPAAAAGPGVSAVPTPGLAMGPLTARTAAQSRVAVAILGALIMLMIGIATIRFVRARAKDPATEAPAVSLTPVPMPSVTTEDPAAASAATTTVAPVASLSPVVASAEPSVPTPTSVPTTKPTQTPKRPTTPTPKPTGALTRPPPIR